MQVLVPVTGTFLIGTGGRPGLLLGLLTLSVKKIIQKWKLLEHQNDGYYQKPEIFKRIILTDNVIITLFPIALKDEPYAQPLYYPMF